MAIINCNECHREVSDKARACPGCGAPLVIPSVDYSGNKHDVDIVWTILFGPFYLFYKGWFLSAFMYVLVCLVSGGLWWLIGPMFVNSLVNYFER